MARFRGLALRLLVAVVLMLGFSPVHPAQSYNPISGTVVWAVDQVIATDVVVLNGASLTIQTGVAVTMLCGIDPAPYSSGLSTKIEIIVENGGALSMDGAIIHGDGNGGCWQGITFLSGSGGNILNSTIQDATIGIAIQSSSPQILGNTITNLSGDAQTPSALAGNAAGIWVDGVGASPVISENTIQSVLGGFGLNGQTVSPGGNAYGVLITSGASPTIQDNDILYIYGGDGGVGQGGPAGLPGTPGTEFNPNGGNGTDGGPGTGGGGGGEAVGIALTSASAVVTGNFISDVRGGMGGFGGAGGPGGAGGNGYGATDMDVGLTGGNGGNGGGGGAGGLGGGGGVAAGIRSLLGAPLTAFDNYIQIVLGGAAGDGGPGGPGADGGLGGNGGNGAPGTPPGAGGNGGAAGAGGPGGGGGLGGQADGIHLHDTNLPQPLDRSSTYTILAGNGGGGGSGGPGGMNGGAGGMGGSSPLNPGGNGGTGGAGGNGGTAGAGGLGGLAAGLRFENFTGVTVVTNHLEVDVAGGNGGVGGNGAPGGMGGMGGAGGMGPVQQAPGGNGGNGGNGGAAGAGGGSGDAQLAYLQQTTAILTNNTLVEVYAASSGGAAGMVGPGGMGGPGGLGVPPGTGGTNGSSGATSVPGTGGLAYGVLSFTGGIGQIHNTVLANFLYRANGTALAQLGGGIVPVEDYNNLWNWGVNYSGVPVGAQTIVADPLFVDPSNNNFHLTTPGAPGIDSANPSAPLCPTMDHDTIARPIDGNNDGMVIVDRGAFEDGSYLQFDLAATSTNEDEVVLMITVSRQGNPALAAAVQYATGGGDATAGQDYDSASGALNWTAGDASGKTIQIAIHEDTLEEVDETLNVTLSNPSTAFLGSPAVHTITILDDDAPGVCTIQFAQTASSAGENAGTTIITATRTGGGCSAAGSADYAVTGGTATPGSDFTGGSGTLNWAAGETGAKTFSLMITDDAEDELDETVVFDLSNLTGATAGTPFQTILTIGDNDTCQVAFSSTGYAVLEDDTRANITVSLDQACAAAAQVDYATSNGSAQSGSDYTGTSGTLFWSAGDPAPQTFFVNILPDTETEGDETVNLTLGNPAGANLGEPGTAVLTIIDDENPSTCLVQFTAVEYAVDEAALSASITVMVQPAAQCAAGLSVDYATSDGTAAAGADYTTVSGTLTWAAGNTGSQMFSIPLLDDNLVEGNESVILALSNPLGAILGSPASAVLVIREDDIAQYIYLPIILK